MLFTSNVILNEMLTMISFPTDVPIMRGVYRSDVVLLSISACLKNFTPRRFVEAARMGHTFHHLVFTWGNHPQPCSNLSYCGWRRILWLKVGGVGLKLIRSQRARMFSEMFK